MIDEKTKQIETKFENQSLTFEKLLIKNIKDDFEKQESNIQNQFSENQNFLQKALNELITIQL